MRRKERERGGGGGLTVLEGVALPEEGLRGFASAVTLRLLAAVASLITLPLLLLILKQVTGNRGNGRAIMSDVIYSQ